MFFFFFIIIFIDLDIEKNDQNIQSIGWEKKLSSDILKILLLVKPSVLRGLTYKVFFSYIL